LFDWRRKQMEAARAGIPRGTEAAPPA